MIFRTAAITLAVVLITTSASAMCGGGTKSEKNQAAGRMQCGGGMGGMDVAAKPDAAAKDNAGKADDPHAGMDMGEGKSDGMKSGQMAMGCCGCCGAGMGGGQKSGGMCSQASAVTEDGKNDPLLSDPMWNKSKKHPQSVPPPAQQ